MPYVFGVGLPFFPQVMVTTVGLRVGAHASVLGRCLLWADTVLHGVEGHVTSRQLFPVPVEDTCSSYQGRWPRVRVGSADWPATLAGFQTWLPSFLAVGLRQDT